MKVTNTGKDILFLIEVRRVLYFCSDDDLIYPNRLITSSSIIGQNTNDDWILVEPGHDQRPKALPEFKKKVGPAFPVDSCSTPATFYNEMLPDSLFDHIVMCTNTRARVYFHSILPSSQSQNTWKSVRLFSRFLTYLKSRFWGFPWWNEKVLCDRCSDGYDS